MESILVSIFLFYFMYNSIQVSAFPKRATESFIIHYLEDRRIIPVRIELNTNQQTEHVMSIGGETLYDFNKGKVAYKDINSSQCFIADIAEETLEGDRRRLKTLRNGIVRGFYLPTFIIQEELTNKTNLLESFGFILTDFCNGNTVSFVLKQKHRRKRDTSGDQGQFTHHSYGHYGHQSNNYAHYGHETHITGTVDKDGQIRNHRVNHQQVKSESSQVYPRPGSQNGGRDSTVDSRTSISTPQTQYQTQSRIPSYQQTYGGNGKNFGTGGTGQFALQSTHEGGYQLNLPLGLQAGNIYRGGVRSSGHYGVGGSQPQITTEYQKYPDSTYHQPGQAGLRRPLPPSSAPGISYPSTIQSQTGLTPEDQLKIRDRTGERTFPDYHDTDQSKLTQRLPGIPGKDTGRYPTVTQPGVSSPDIRRYPTLTQPGIPGSDTRFPTLTQPGISGSDIGRFPTLSQPGTSGTDIGRFPTLTQPGIPGTDIGRFPTLTQPGISGTDIGRFPTLTQQGIPGTDIGRFPTFTQPGIPGTDIGRFPTLTQPGILSPVSTTTTGDRRIGTPSGAPVVHVPDAHTDSRTFTTSDQSLPSTDYGYQDRKLVDQRIIPSGQTPSKIDHSVFSPTSLHPGSAILAPGTQPGFQPGISTPSIHMPGRTIQGPFGLPGQISTGTSESERTGTQPISGLSRPGYEIPSPHAQRQQFIPSGLMPGQQYLQTNGIRYPPGYGINGDIPRTQVPISQIPGISPGYPSTIGAGGPGVIQISRPRPSTTVSGAPLSYLPGSTETIRDGIRYHGGLYPQTHAGVGDDYSRRGTYSGVPGIPDDRTLITSVQPGDRRLLPTGPVPPESVRDPTTLRDSRYGLSVPSRGIGSDLPASLDRRIATGQTGLESSKTFGQDSASSQTQIQSGLEGTAAEASAAGHSRGLGSQTQVQGGYVGNGSFSAQAQSGFTGGVVQSQVQGGKQGGLSGSSAQVERLGAAQSQVQIAQPSGSASSSAQGKFTGGTTQVQAQSSKTSGSAGAQSQSTGLSSSQVQVNIGGKEVSEKEHFQGTVSASVHGGHSSGQSQTQLQGGYDSGRTYVATAQGGFDSNSGFQASVPALSPLTTLSNQTLGAQQPFSVGSSQEPTGTTGRQLPLSGSPGFRAPTGATVSRDQITGRDVYTHPSRTLPDSSRQFGTSGLPQYQIPSSSPHTLIPSTAQTTELGARHPSTAHGTQLPSHLIPSPQSVTRYTYPDSQTGLPGISSVTRDGRLIPISHDAPGYRRYDERGVIPSDTSPGFPQTSVLTQDRPAFLPGTIPTGFQPGIQQSSLLTPGLRPQSSQELTHPSGVVPTFPHQTDQLHASRFTPSYPLDSRSHLQQPGLPTHQTAITSGLQPGLPTHQTAITPGLQPGLPTHGLQPGLQRGHYVPPSTFPEQPQISVPSPQIISSHRQPGEIPVLTRPDGSYFAQFKPTIQHPESIPGQTQIQPGQPQILSQRPQIPLQQPHILPPSTQFQPQHHQISSARPQVHPQWPNILPPSTQFQPEHHQISPSRPQVQPQQPHILPPSTQFRPEHHQISPLRPQFPPTSERVPTPIIPSTSETTDIKSGRLPGVSEPHKRGCCEALRDLKRRCCGRTSKQDEASSCCGSGTDDIFDFSSEDDLDESKEPCKVVKAICYIVYKPVGKARVCKPTATNGC